MQAAAISVLATWLVCLSGVSGEGPDNLGREFILSFIENEIQNGYSPNDLEIFFTTVSNTPANVNITTPVFNDLFLQQIVVTRGSVEMITITYTLRGTGTELAYKTLHIESDVEVVVYAVNKEKWSTDAFVAIPVDAVGKEYYVMTYYEETEFSIAGIVDSTSVTITFPDPGAFTIDVTYNGVNYGNNGVLTLTINRFQAFHCYQDNQFWSDFTGTHIVSDQPITVVSGNKKVAVPTTGTSSDHLTEILFPVECWGKKYFSYSTPDRTIGDIMRIMAAEDGTTVTLTDNAGTTSLSLNAGQFQEYDVATDNVMTIESNYGITVGIFSKTFQNDGPNYGDPAFSFLIPEPLYCADYTYSTIKLPSGDHFNNKLSIVIHEDNSGGLRLDEGTITVSWAEIPGSNGFVTGWLYVDAGSHNIYHTDPSKIFMAIATGTEQFNSYAFSSGQRMTQINMPCFPSSMSAGDILDNDCDGAVDEEELNSLDDDGDGLIDEDLALPPRVNGEWSEWSNWTECSMTCLDVGIQTRTRECDNPAPANNGIYCIGNATEYLVCNNTDVYCGIWQVWAEWSECSVTCNDGVRSRERNCTDAFTFQPSDCGPTGYNETEICDVGPLQGVCHNNVSGNCSHCDWGYTSIQCDWCVNNYTGCYCEYCRTDLIGYNTNCSTSCYNGYASSYGGDVCECYTNTTYGFWQATSCDECMDGFVMPDCLDCDTGWEGVDHCSIPCYNGTHAFDYDGATDDQIVVPEFTCVVATSSSFVNAWFGYSSFNAKIVTIPVGANNEVVGATPISQETEFRPGYHQYAFLAGPLPVGDSATWTLAYTAGGSNYTVAIPTLNATYCNDSESKWNLADVSPSLDIGYCKCNTGYHGASCQNVCPGGTDNPCSLNGDCRWTDGICVCQARWTSEDYDFSLYTEGYVSSNPSYKCDECSTDWYGADCSTARLNRTVNGSDYYATIFSSEIITLDGASLTLVKPGAYRLLQSDDIVLDGFFVPCKGRHECHSLQEVALNYNNVTLSFAVNDNGLTVLNASINTDTTYPWNYNSGNLTVTGIVDDVIRYTFEDGTQIVVSNINGELVLGVVVPQNHTGVTGLLGNADNDWVNDVTTTANQMTYAPSDLVATQKAADAARYQLNAGNTVLLQSDVDTPMGSAGFALLLPDTSNGANVSGLSFQSMDEFSLEMWAKVPTISGTTAVLATMDTSEGPLELSVVNGKLVVNWDGNAFVSSVDVPADTWTYVSVNWESVDGNVTVAAIDNVGSGSSDTQGGFNTGGSLSSLTSLSFGGGSSDTDIILDYIRLFDKGRNSSDMLSDHTTYTENFIDYQRLVVLFDEGQDTGFTTYVSAWNMDETYTGTIHSGNWTYSTAPVEDILTASTLSSIVADSVAVSACITELQGSVFTSNCPNFGSINQLIMENCIRDYMRTNNSNIVKLAGSAFVYYCQAVTQSDVCLFSSYLDFCQSSSSSTSSGASSMIMAAAAGAGLLVMAAVAAACCCCIKAIIGRKKIRDDDDEEEEEEEEEELEENQQPPIQDSTSTTGLKASLPPATTGIAMVGPAAMKMREPSKFSLGPEKPFEPLHVGRWTGYGWLPGARPVEGVSSTPPDVLERQASNLDNLAFGAESGSIGDQPSPESGNPPSSPPPCQSSEGIPAPRKHSGMGSVGRVNTLTSISLSVDSAREPTSLLPPVTGTARD